MDEATLTRESRFLSFVLRHHPEAVGIALDAQGWVAVDDLLAGCRAHGHPLTRELLDEIPEWKPTRRA